MPQRPLHFDSVSQLLAELDRLESAGYTPSGKWSLGQICEHLSYYVRGSLDGFGFRLPWIVRALLGPPLKRKLLADKPMPVGSRTIPASIPTPAPADEGPRVSAFRDLMRRFESHPGPFHPSPLFGQFTREEWLKLHLNHAAHHLAFLVPKQLGTSA